MDALWNLEAVRSVNNLKSLRHLFDTVEAHVRGLRALGVPSTSYGELLTSVLMNKLPQELQLLIGRKLGEDDWTLDAIMVIFETEVTIRESTATVVSHHVTPKPTKPSASNRTCPTLNSFMTTNQVSCAYCSQSHPSASCRLISTVEDRKQALMKSGRCFNCLRRGHIGRDCRSSTKCNPCSGRNHISLCARSTRITITPPTTTQTTSTPTPPTLYLRGYSDSCSSANCQSQNWQPVYRSVFRSSSNTGLWKSTNLYNEASTGNPLTEGSTN